MRYSTRGEQGGDASGGSVTMHFQRWRRRRIDKIWIKKKQLYTVDPRGAWLIAKISWIFIFMHWPFYRVDDLFREFITDYRRAIPENKIVMMDSTAV